jgi:hypothetical protein
VCVRSLFTFKEREVLSENEMTSYTTNAQDPKLLNVMHSSQGSSVSTQTKLWAGRPGFDSWQGQQLDTFFLHRPRPDRIWSPPNLLFGRRRGGGLLPRGVKRPRREGDYSPPSSAGPNAWSYTSTPPARLHCVVLN